MELPFLKSSFGRERVKRRDPESLWVHVPGTDSRAVELLPIARLGWHPGCSLGWLGPFQTQMMRRSRRLNLIPVADLTMEKQKQLL